MTSTTPTTAALGTPLAGSSAAAAASSSTSGNTASLAISPTQFLRLITAQLQDQNPLQPADPTQFLSQLEGLSQVSSLQGLQTELASNIQAAQMASGTSLLGRTVLSSGSSATLAAGGTISGAASAPSGATSLTVSIGDARGNTIQSFVVPAQAAGLTTFSWDGTTAAGAAAPAGQYSITVNATVGSSSQSVSPLIASKVTSVTIDPSTQTLDLNTGNGIVPLTSVVSVQ
jgi:flagellar basal-body rod modification protein FlgD